MKPAEQHPEKRKGRRFELRAPVFFTVKTAAGTSATRSGVTRDVGPGGLFFRTDAGQDIAPERKVNVRVVIAREGASQSQGSVALSAEARVVRMERLNSPRDGSAYGLNSAGEQWGIAVQFVGRPTVDLASLFFDSAPSPS